MPHDTEVTWSKIASKFTNLIRNILLKKREKLQYDLKIEEYTVAAVTHFNEQVSQDFANFGMASPNNIFAICKQSDFCKTS